MENGFYGHILFNYTSFKPFVPVELTSVIKKKSILYKGWIDSGATNIIVSKKIADDLILWNEGDVEAPLANGEFEILNKMTSNREDATFSEFSALMGEIVELEKDVQKLDKEINKKLDAILKYFKIF